MRIGDTLKKAAGLFVTFDDSGVQDPSQSSVAMAEDLPPARTVEQIVQQSPGPNLDQIKVPNNVAPPTPAADGSGDFGKIYQQANVPASPFTAEQVMDLIATLPAELPLETKRQTVKMTLTAMTKTLGVSPDIVVTDASRKLAALAAFSDHFTKDAATYIANAETDISSMQAQIEAKKKAIEDAKAQQTKVVEMCHKESDRLDDILEFLSLDVAPSKYATSDPAKS